MLVSCVCSTRLQSVWASLLTMPCSHRLPRTVLRSQPHPPARRRVSDSNKSPGYQRHQRSSEGTLKGTGLTHQFCFVCLSGEDFHRLPFFDGLQQGLIDLRCTEIWKVRSTCTAMAPGDLCCWYLLVALCYANQATDSMRDNQQAVLDPFGPRS